MHWRKNAQAPAPATVIAVGLLLVLPLFVASCGGDDDNSNATGDTATTISEEALAAEFDAYVGLTEQEASAKAKDAGFTSRVIMRDGQSVPATMDYNPDRLNFVIESGKVTLVTTG